MRIKISFNVLKTKLLFLLISFFSILPSVHAENEAMLPVQITKEAEKNTQFLLGHVLQKTKALQETYGDFAPFGAGLFPNGQVKYVWLAKPGEKVADPAKALPVVRQVLKSQADSGRLLASAVIYKYDPGTGVQINTELEYLSGYAVVVGTKFSVDEKNVVTLGQAGMKPYSAKIFVKEEGQLEDDSNN